MDCSFAPARCRDVTIFERLNHVVSGTLFTLGLPKPSIWQCNHSRTRNHLRQSIPRRVLIFQRAKRVQERLSFSRLGTSTAGSLRTPQLSWAANQPFFNWVSGVKCDLANCTVSRYHLCARTTRRVTDSYRANRTVAWPFTICDDRDDSAPRRRRIRRTRTVHWR